MEAVHLFRVDKVKLAKKGQITIPKVIREEDHLQENDVLILTHMPGGDIVLRKQRKKSPEEALIEILLRTPPFDAKTAWEEVRQERRRERS